MTEMISTIITTYRRPLLLKRAINSVLKQTYPHFQVYVYDNASGDETEKIAHDLMKKDSRVKYHRHPENIGMMANYQYALDRIDTPFFSFLSDDDFLLPHFYEEALNSFQKFPNAAFSACGVWQMDEKGGFIDDPLSRWESDGFFSAPRGLLEMIKTNHGFPVPTGILFQSKYLQDIKPDFCNEIQFFWDPDYLIRIASRHPIVIQKKTCGIYLAHSESFAQSFYNNLLKNEKKIEDYLVATKKTLNSIKNDKSLIFLDRYKAAKHFNKYIEANIRLFIRLYSGESKLGGAHFLAKRYFAFFGFSRKIISLHALVILMKLRKTTKILLQTLCKLKMFMSCFFKKKLFKPAHINNEIESNQKKLDDLQKYHNYGQELYKE